MSTPQETPPHLGEPFSTEDVTVVPQQQFLGASWSVTVTRGPIEEVYKFADPKFIGTAYVIDERPVLDQKGMQAFDEYGEPLTESYCREVP